MNDLALLDTISQTCDMGRESLLQVLDKAEDTGLCEKLSAQINEYDKLYSKAESMFSAMHQAPRNANPVAKAQSQAMVEIKTTFANDETSKIAEMVMQGSTMGVTKVTKNLHAYTGDNQDIINLAEKLIKTEEANIQQMKEFL